MALTRPHRRYRAMKHECLDENSLAADLSQHLLKERRRIHFPKKIRKSQATRLGLRNSGGESKRSRNSWTSDAKETSTKRINGGDTKFRSTVQRRISRCSSVARDRLRRSISRVRSRCGSPPQQLGSTPPVIRMNKAKSAVENAHLVNRNSMVRLAPQRIVSPRRKVESVSRINLECRVTLERQIFPELKGFRESRILKDRRAIGNRGVNPTHRITLGAENNTEGQVKTKNPNSRQYQVNPPRRNRPTDRTNTQSMDSLKHCVNPKVRALLGRRLSHMNQGISVSPASAGGRVGKVREATSVCKKGSSRKALTNCSRSTMVHGNSPKQSHIIVNQGTNPHNKQIPMTRNVQDQETSVISPNRPTSQSSQATKIDEQDTAIPVKNGGETDLVNPPKHKSRSNTSKPKRCNGVNLRHQYVPDRKKCPEDLGNTIPIKRKNGHVSHVMNVNQECERILMDAQSTDESENSLGLTPISEQSHKRKKYTLFGQSLRLKPSDVEVIQRSWAQYMGLKACVPDTKIEASYTVSDMYLEETEDITEKPNGTESRVDAEDTPNTEEIDVVVIEESTALTHNTVINTDSASRDMEDVNQVANERDGLMADPISARSDNVSEHFARPDWPKLWGYSSSHPSTWLLEYRCKLSGSEDDVTDRNDNSGRLRILGKDNSKSGPEEVWVTQRLNKLKLPKDLVNRRWARVLLHPNLQVLISGYQHESWSQPETITLQNITPLILIKDWTTWTIHSKVEEIHGCLSYTDQLPPYPLRGTPIAPSFMGLRIFDLTIEELSCAKSICPNYEPLRFGNVTLFLDNPISSMQKQYPVKTFQQHDVCSESPSNLRLIEPTSYLEGIRGKSQLEIEGDLAQQLGNFGFYEEPIIKVKQDCDAPELVEKTANNFIDMRSNNGQSLEHKCINDEGRVFFHADLGPVSGPRRISVLASAPPDPNKSGEEQPTTINLHGSAEMGNSYQFIFLHEDVTWNTAKEKDMIVASSPAACCAQTGTIIHRFRRKYYDQDFSKFYVHGRVYRNSKLGSLALAELTNEEKAFLSPSGVTFVPPEYITGCKSCGNTELVFPPSCVTRTWRMAVDKIPDDHSLLRRHFFLTELPPRGNTDGPSLPLLISTEKSPHLKFAKPLEEPICVPRIREMLRSPFQYIFGHHSGPVATFPARRHWIDRDGNVNVKVKPDNVICYKHTDTAAAGSGTPKVLPFTRDDWIRDRRDYTVHGKLSKTRTHLQLSKLTEEEKRVVATACPNYRPLELYEDE